MNRDATVTEAVLDDVYSDDIAIPATDGYQLAATLYLPRGAKHHAVLINSATAVPRATNMLRMPVTLRVLL